MSEQANERTRRTDNYRFFNFARWRPRGSSSSRRGRRAARVLAGCCRRAREREEKAASIMALLVSTVASRDRAIMSQLVSDSASRDTKPGRAHAAKLSGEKSRR